MSTLNGKERSALPAKAFGLPGQRKYPMPDKSHAANAKARASEMERKGRISKSTEESIDRKADSVLGGGAAKGHRNIVNAKSHHEKMRHS